MKTNILLADLKVSIEHKYEFMKSFCRKYEAQFDVADIVAKTNDDAIKKENQMVPTAPIEICESLCLYRCIAEQLPQFDRFVFHGAAIEFDGNAYLFTAPSGTGKTTHINLWKKNLGDRVDIINGDKPIISLKNGITVYGTPWAGKEGLHRNASAPLKAICVLKQGIVNKITKLQSSQAVNYIMRQVYMPHNAEALSKTLTLIGKIIETIPVYILECDISNEAFETSFNEITK